MYETVPLHVLALDSNSINSNSALNQNEPQADLGRSDSIIQTTTEEDGYFNDRPVFIEGEVSPASEDSENFNDKLDDTDLHLIEIFQSTRIDEIEDELRQEYEDDEEEQRPVEDLADALEDTLSIKDNHKYPQEGLSSMTEYHPLREEFSSAEDEEDEQDANDTNDYTGFNSEWGGHDDRNTLTNDIDGYGSVPIDLSNDIAVNDILAQRGAPVNPDAEIFRVGQSPNRYRLTSQRDIK